MKKVFRKIGVLTSGGDAPGMNSVIKSVTCAAIEKGVEVVGILGGYSGLINERLRPLTKNDVAGIVSLGGTVLYSDRCDEFKTEEGMQKAIATCKKYNIDGIVAIGGDGTFRGATDLSIRGIPCIGVSGTIDNDITATDVTVGYDTAMNTVLALGDRLRDTCESHARCNVIEVMGRHAGYIAIETGLALGAIGVAVQEVPFDKEALFKKMKASRDAGQRSFIVVVAEGLGSEFSEGLAKEIEEETGVETRFVRPAHIVRGGIPTLADRNFAAKSGYKAVEVLLDGISDVVICSRHDEIVPIDIKYALILDRMYKNKLKDGDLDSFSNEQIEEMKKICAERKKYFTDMYEVVNAIGC
ncbi:MAG: ATP-dependent 6-phosphofructokinase [Clostridia bacterium]|nr:ATP-dependent 6-phosphofructokinase [Clostridia bacterium]MBQ7789496.1 ATP-dependent 6-phosphofructokinase [Clostridia bacterium]